VNPSPAHYLCVGGRTIRLLALLDLPGASRTKTSIEGLEHVGPQYSPTTPFTPSVNMWDKHLELKGAFLIRVELFTPLFNDDFGNIKRGTFYVISRDQLIQKTAERRFILVTVHKSCNDFASLNSETRTQVSNFHLD
jgi:hypothetical protein